MRYLHINFFFKKINEAQSEVMNVHSVRHVQQYCRNTSSCLGFGKLDFGLCETFWVHCEPPKVLSCAFPCKWLFLLPCVKKVFLLDHAVCSCVRLQPQARQCVCMRVRVNTAQRVAAHQFPLAQRGNWPSIDGRGSLFTLQGPRLFVWEVEGDMLAWHARLK